MQNFFGQIKHTLTLRKFIFDILYVIWEDSLLNFTLLTFKSSWEALPCGRKFKSGHAIGPKIDR